MIDTTRPAAPHPRRGRRVTVAVLLTAGLASGAAIAATAANASGPGSTDTSSGRSAPSTSNPSPPGSGKRPPAPKPHLDGTVRSVSGMTITITDPEGFTRTIAASASTTFIRDGRSVTDSSVVVGRFVHAEGSVDSNGTTLDATSVAVMASAPKPGAGPAGRPGPGGRNMPMPAKPAAGGTLPSPPKVGATPRARKNRSAPAAPGNGSAPAAPSASGTAHGS